MSKDSKIEWTDATFNPWWGCTKVSPGCDHCYADTLATRYGHNIWGPDAPRRFFGDKHWAEPLKWNRDAEQAGVRRRVFCGSMCDWAEGRKDQAAARLRLFDLIETTPFLDWQLLTKRPGAIPHLVPRHWLDTPPANVWYGTSVENQEQADRRIPQLLAVPAVVRFLSCEPLLGPVDLTTCVKPSDDDWEQVNMLQDANDDGEPEEFVEECEAELDWINYGHRLVENPAHLEWAAWRRQRARLFALERQIHWVIAGGESGPGARPMHPDWARSLRDQCQAAGVAFHFKQWGEWAPVYSAGDDPDGRSVMALPDGTLTDADWNGGAGPHLRGAQALYRLGKKKAGRLLGDPEHGPGSLHYEWGRTWDEFPQTAMEVH